MPQQAPSPQQFAPQQAGWAPPPKPGLIPLRPLDFGTILGAPYQALRRNPRPTFGISLLIQGGLLFLTLLVVGLATWFSVSRIDFASTSADADEIAAGSIATILLSSLIPVGLSIVATGFLQGILVLEVSRQSLGEKLRFPQLWAMAKGRVWAVAGYTVLLTLAILLGIGIAAGIVVGAVALGGDAGIGVGVALGILLVLGLIVLYAFLGTKLAFVPSVIMLERTTIRQAMARSWALTNRSFWKTLGILLLVALIINIATSIVTAPVQLLVSFLPVMFAPTGEETTMLVLLGLGYLVLVVVTLVVSAIALVIQSATTALLYIDQRIRKEGLDLELARFVEAKQSGALDLPDPYATA